MIAEHIFYSGALAILVGMVFYKLTGRDSSWIIILCAWAPDVFGIIIPLLNHAGVTLFSMWYYILNPVLHTVAAMVIFGFIMAYLLRMSGLRFADTFFFSIIGYGSHLVEDALVYKSGYMYLWPYSWERLGTSLLPNVFSTENYIIDFFYIADTGVLIIGIAFFLVAIAIRTWYEGRSWIRFYMPDTVYVTLFGKT